MIRKDALSTEIKVLCALNFFAFGSYQKKVGNDLPILMSQGTPFSHSIREVSEAMSKTLLQKYGKFPDDQNAQKTVKEEFKFCVLEGVLGTVDCTHVAIIAPSNVGYHHESNYVNIRGWHSINVHSSKVFYLNLIRDAFSCKDEKHIEKSFFFIQSYLKIYISCK
ncbi:unnamed protein product [Larinioides sclopetarius]|uniref:Nuclease HARBI1 n=1 Tax=Larinioides sclopetarius TaxID=280406 RepID=A0AAV2BQT8_9ARAC